MAHIDARREAEKLRIHALNIALAAKTGKEGDLREATNLLISEAAEALDRFARQACGIA